jgi:hypothetical protein
VQVQTFKLGQAEKFASETKRGEGEERNKKHTSHSTLGLTCIQTPEISEARSPSFDQYIVFLYEKKPRNDKATTAYNHRKLLPTIPGDKKHTAQSHTTEGRTQRLTVY